MNDVLQALMSSPLLALLGAGALLTILLIPLVLRASGMSGKQILDTIALTLQFFTGLVGATREQNRSEKNNHEPPSD